MRSIPCFIFTICILFLSGCASIGLQSKRIFQQKTREPVIKEVTEDIKQAADYLAKNVSDPAEAKEVAIDLSQRAGAPLTPLSEAEDVSDSLIEGNADYEKDLKKLMEWLEKYEGQPTEGTGLSVWGLGGALVIGGLLVLCMLVPALIPLVLQIIQTIGGTSRAVFKQTTASVVESIKEYKRKNPGAVKELTEIIGKNMDSKGKALVTKIKSQSII